MSQKMLGVDIYRTDTIAVHEPGLIVDDVRGGQGEITTKEYIDGPTVYRRYSPDGKYKYVRATNAIAGGDSVMIDVAATDEPAGVTPTTGVTSSVEGIAVVAIAAQSYGWIQVAGRVPVGISSATAADRFGARMTAAGAAGERKVASATAGALVTSGKTAAEASDEGRKIIQLDAATDLDPGGGTDLRAEVYIY